jgi:hypothetical protein
METSLFRKEVGFEVGSDSKVGFYFPTYIFLHINEQMSVKFCLSYMRENKLNINVGPTSKFLLLKNHTYLDVWKKTY